jgi:hypothetical protein
MSPPPRCESMNSAFCYTPQRSAATHLARAALKWTSEPCSGTAPLPVRCIVSHRVALHFLLLQFSPPQLPASAQLNNKRTPHAVLHVPVSRSRTHRFLAALAHRHFTLPRLRRLARACCSAPGYCFFPSLLFTAFCAKLARGGEGNAVVAGVDEE